MASDQYEAEVGGESEESGDVDHMENDEAQPNIEAKVHEQLDGSHSHVVITLTDPELFDCSICGRCVYSPCYCPHLNCKFVSSVKTLYQHFSNGHVNSATQFEYYVIFHVSLNADDNFLVRQEKKGGTLFILKRHHAADLGNAVTISCIQPGFMGGFFHELDVKSKENFLRLESFTKSTPSRQVIDDRPPKTGFLLILFDFISSGGQLKMEICIWPVGASPSTLRSNHVA